MKCIALALGVALLSGCAATRPVPRELVEAREAIRRAETSPAANKAPGELSTAKRALVSAEAAETEDPGSDAARDRAYLAWRAAEHARIAGLYAADLDALARGRAAVERLSRNIEKHRADEKMQAWLDGEEERLRDEAQARREYALEQHAKAFDAIHRDDTGPRLVLACSHLFVPGQIRLAPGAKARLDTTVRVLRIGPAPKLRIIVATNDAANGTDAALLAQHRAERLRDELVNRGYPPELIDVQSRVAADASIAFCVDERSPAANAVAR